MIGLLLRAAIFLGSAAIGVLVATWILDDMTVTAGGFIVTIVIFALAQSILTPFIAKMVSRHAAAFLGGIGLLSTFVALFLATLFGSALTIDGVMTWIAATVLVWLFTALATLFLPMVVLSKAVNGDKPGRRAR